jgi:hypothetical protein
MPNYANAKIYKVVDNTSDKIYIGSTCKTLSGRLSAHKSSFKVDNAKYCTVFEILKNENFDIILLENVENCTDKEQLRARERFYIETNNNCVNKNIPNHTKAESDKVYYEKHKEKIKENVKQWRLNNIEEFKVKSKIRGKIYREENREKEKARQKKYREENQDKVKDYAHDYNNKEETKQRMKQYREDNKERIRQQQKEWYERKKNKTI